jgi:hypothetical protein
VFSFIDLYIGLILLDSLIPTLAAEKRNRAVKAKKIVIGLLVLNAIALAGMYIRR